MEENHK